MKGLKLDPDGRGGFVLTDKLVEGRNCLRQNAAVNLATIVGTDKCFLTKGTRLLTSAVQGVIFDKQSAQHAANFAALDTLTFLQIHDYTEEVPNQPTNIQLQLIAIAPGRLTYQVSFTFPDQTATDTLVI